MHSGMQNYRGWGALRAPEDFPGRGKSSVLALSIGARHAAQDHCILQWIMPPRALLHYKYAAVRAVARDIINMH